MGGNNMEVIDKNCLGCTDPIFRFIESSKNTQQFCENCRFYMKAMEKDSNKINKPPKKIKPKMPSNKKLHSLSDDELLNKRDKNPQKRGGNLNLYYKYIIVIADRACD